MKLVEEQIDEVGIGWSRWEQLVKDFLASGVEAAEVTEFDGTPINACNTLSTHLKRHELPVRCSRRGTRVYLLREAE